MESSPVQVEIHDLSAEGSGVGRLPGGRAVFVPWTAPGDQARIRIVDERERWARGTLVALDRPSDVRRQPRCPLYGRCGGCRLQHLRYRDQVDWKARRIREALRRIGRREVDEIYVEASDREWGYRNRMSFTLRRLRSGRVVAGLHHVDAPGRIVDIGAECLLPEEPILRAWVGLRDSWGPGARHLPPGGSLRLTLRNGTEGVALLVEGGEAGGDAETLLDAVDALVSVSHRPRNQEWQHLAGLEKSRDVALGEEFAVGAGAFLQVNRSGGEALHRSVLGEMGNPSGLRIVDGYCGVGAYGRRLARHGADVVGIELDEEAVREADRDAPHGFRVVRGRVEDHLADLLPADRVILNPPRTGLDARVARVLRDRPVERVLYVSCDPATLARDLERMGSGYALRRVQGFDLFPQTPHVETVVTLDATTHRQAM